MRRFFIFIILMSGFWGCRKEKEKSDDIEVFMQIPAIARYNFSLSQPTLVIPFDTLIAPQLLTDNAFYLLEGLPLLVSFFINYDRQPFDEYTTLWGDLGFTPLKMEKAQATTGGESEKDGFDVSIDKITPYAMIDQIAFFYFTHTVFGIYLIYEMTYDPGDTSEIPTIYFRAKESDKDNGIFPNEPFIYFCTFDLNDFLLERRNSEKMIKVNIKYKTGTENGKDVYKDWESNPLELSFR